MASDILERLAGEPEPEPPTLDGALREVRRVALTFPPYWQSDATWRADFTAAQDRARTAGATEAEIAVAALKA